ncbi:class II fructose-bisphosphate aldolase [Salipiger sp. IMCC34102]|uniref:class II fructose-bisphosphate aldolase n=1 Tax=Salipiger sp. IMCC34102 TaxID=2510647 RepID=UPI00101CE91E|nr:class II fructose-bisphosphate aldolase [Salipiger sp. IMCC34102]RYH02112.1 class II fructose-bisphosphate aldolase [Salipiger sp. IMCC34102]
MTRATLKDVLPAANAHGYAVPGFVCLGWEDARAYVAAAEAEAAPVILQAGPSCRAHTPLPVLAAMFLHLADQASVPVVAHLDHGHTLAECEEALRCGFTSVMFDGSRLPLEENIAQTKTVVDLARRFGASCEGELGFVGYAEGAASKGTDPDEVGPFVTETGVDALAISVGNVHLQTSAGQALDRERLQAIARQTPVPLVIHGGSGLGLEDRQDLPAQTLIAKINVGTELRRVFGQALRNFLSADPDLFDRIAILSASEPPLTDAARKVIRQFGAGGQARSMLRL